MKTEELKDKIYRAIGLAANADGIINQALATEYVMTNIQSELSTPSHSEETETTEKAPFDLPLKVVDGQIRCAFGSNVISRFPYNIKDDKKQYIVTAVNSHSSLVRRVEEQKEEIERLKEIAKDHTIKLHDSMVDNEAKEKRIEELESVLKRAESSYVNLVAEGREVFRASLAKVRDVLYKSK